ncbi:Calycin-like protein [Jimgerdemannia flammicorona]|uniref:Calycin-like protein n=1 Tax=Jimgerdemannia flammicorona TaxID=994334 RepID=A0A433D2B3_9FUNG|nr:Calycin-like protein [Jimgerdemannia flammicorona]
MCSDAHVIPKPLHVTLDDKSQRVRHALLTRVGPMSLPCLRGMSSTSSHPLAFLVGTWKGKGVGKYPRTLLVTHRLVITPPPSHLSPLGIYPTIKPFNYGEEITISSSPKGFLVYHQKTWDNETNQPLHAEMGYFRTPGMGEKVELVVVAPNGLASVEEGIISGTEVNLSSKILARTSTAKVCFCSSGLQD